MRWNLTFCLTLLQAVAICHLMADTTSTNYSNLNSRDPYYVNGSKTLYFQNPDPTPQLLDFVHAVNSQNNPTVESALALFPRTMRTNYVLMYDSGSIQGSSYVNPRAIFFSPSADLIVSFNGHPDQVGGKTLEILSFNPQVSAYDFVELDFSGPRVVVLTNPTKCIACHTDAHIPNWRPYNNWSGAFGGKDGNFRFIQNDTGTKSVFGTGDSQETLYGELQTSGASVFEHFKSFLNSQPSHPRFSLLLKPANEPFWPFSKDMPDSTKDDYDYQPLRRFGIGLAFHQAQTIAARLQKSVLYQNYPASVLSELFQCNPSEVYSPNVASTKPLPSPFEQKLLEVLSNQPLFSTVDQINKAATQGGWNREDISYQLLSVSGVFPELWMMDLTYRMNKIPESRPEESIGIAEMDTARIRVGAFLFSQFNRKIGLGIKPDGPTEDMAAGMIAPVQLLRELNKTIPLYSKAKIHGQICPSLTNQVQVEAANNRAIGLELNLAQWRAVKASQAGEPFVLKQCIECHSHDSFGGRAPHIPFDNPMALRQLLKSNNGYLLKEIVRRTDPAAPDGARMPLGPVGLVPYKQMELINYLTQLAK